MKVASLGYAVIEATDIEKWRDYATKVTGFMARDGEDGTLLLSMDDRPFRFMIVPGTSDRMVGPGWECRNEADFEEAIRRLEKAGAPVTRLDDKAAAKRYVNAVAASTDPSGNHFEIYWGRVLGYSQFNSPTGVSGFETGEMGLGHIVLPTPDLQACYAFYTEVLGFGLTDEMWFDIPGGNKLGLYFLHADNPRHHSLAIFQGQAPSGCIHMMVEVRTIDEVGYAMDRATANGYHVSSSLGRHSNDAMLSFYMQTPGGFDLEYGCEGIRPDWSNWVPTKSLIPDLWGHKWSPPPGADPNDAPVH